MSDKSYKFIDKCSKRLYSENDIINHIDRNGWTVDLEICLDSEKLLNIKNYVKSEISSIKSPKMGKNSGHRQGELEILEKILKIIEK